jgi:N-methylhydantoinase A
MAPANFSAWGILSSDYVEDQVRTKVLPFDSAHVGETLPVLDELSERAMNAVAAYGFNREDIVLLRRLDLRFENQEYTITVDLAHDWQDAGAILAGARAQFVASHLRLYGHGDPAANLEQVSVRCRAIGRVRAPDIARIPAQGKVAVPGSRPVYFHGAGGAIETWIFERAALSPGQKLSGPAIVNEWTMTTVIPPNWSCLCDEYGNLILEPSDR